MALTAPNNWSTADWSVFNFRETEPVGIAAATIDLAGGCDADDSPILFWSDGFRLGGTSYQVLVALGRDAPEETRRELQTVLDSFVRLTFES